MPLLQYLPMSLQEKTIQQHRLDLHWKWQLNTYLKDQIARHLLYKFFQGSYEALDI